MPLLFRHWQSMVDGITMADGIMPNLTATLQLLVPLYLLQLSTGPAASHCSLTGDVRRSSKSVQCLPDDVMHSLLVPTINLLHLFLFFFFHLTYSRWASSLPSCLWSQRIFPSLPGSRLTFFYRDASSALLQLVNQWLNFTYTHVPTLSVTKERTQILLW